MNSMPPTYVFECMVCSSRTEEFYKMAERPDEITCACGGNAVRTITAVYLNGKESFLDGHKRKDWAEFREASKLNKESARTRDDAEKKRIAGEIRKLGVDIQKKE